MGSDPIGLTAAPNPDTGRVRLTWSDPTDAFDDHVVQGRPSAGGSWTVFYDGPALTTPAGSVLPCVGEPWDYQVFARAGGVLSSAATVMDVTLAPRAGYLGVWVDDILDPSLSVALGMVDNWSSHKRTRQSVVATLLPFAQQYPRDFPSLVSYDIWDGPPAFTVFATDILSDGTVVDNKAGTIDTLRRMGPPRMVTTLLRLPATDRGAGERIWVKLGSYYDEPLDDQNWTVYPGWTTRAAPASGDIFIPG